MSVIQRQEDEYFDRDPLLFQGRILVLEETEC